MKSTSPEKMSASSTLRSAVSPADAIAANKDDVSWLISPRTVARVTCTSYGTTSAANSPGRSTVGVTRSTPRVCVAQRFWSLSPLDSALIFA